MVDPNIDCLGLEYNKYLLSAYSVPSTILIAWNRVMNKVEKVFALKAYSPMEKMNNKQILCHAVCRALGVEK